MKCHDNLRQTSRQFMTFSVPSPSSRPLLDFTGSGRLLDSDATFMHALTMFCSPGCMGGEDFWLETPAWCDPQTPLFHCRKSCGQRQVNRLMRSNCSRKGRAPKSQALTTENLNLTFPELSLGFSGPVAGVISTLRAQSWKGPGGQEVQNRVENQSKSTTMLGANLSVRFFFGGARFRN